MATARSINLRVRPVSSTDLAYPVDGVVSMQSETLLGSRVRGLRVENLYAMLGEVADGDGSRLEWDSKRIFDYLFNVAEEAARPGMTMLSRLRNVSEAADLDRAIMMRQNAFLTSYSPEVLREVHRVYYDNPRDQSAVRHRLLSAIEGDVGRIHHGLEDGYKKEGWHEKVLHAAHTLSENKATQYSGAGHIQFEGWTETSSKGFEFRYPTAENDLKHHQARAAVRQEFLNAWRMAEMCRMGETTFANELGAIDRSITKLQSAYVDTFLFSPMDGVVTGVFHGMGDHVQAGEPVLRVESDFFVYLVGIVKYRGMLRIGSLVNVTTTLFEAVGGSPVTMSGKVVSVRGHDSVSEQWDVLVLCENFTPAGDVILPLNYHFDFESTTVEVVAF